MAAKRTGLAARLRAAMERERSAHSEAEEAAAEQTAAAQRARDGLFADLRELAGELPFLDLDSSGGGVTFRRGDRCLSFLPEGEQGEVRLSFTGQRDRDTHVLYREAALGDRWIWIRRRGNREDRLPLFDQGLEVLLVHSWVL